MTILLTNLSCNSKEYYHSSNSSSSTTTTTTKANSIMLKSNNGKPHEHDGNPHTDRFADKYTVLCLLACLSGFACSW